MFAKDHVQLTPPVFPERDQLPFDLRGEIAEHGFVGGMNAKSGHGPEAAAAGPAETSAPGKYPWRSKALRGRAPDCGGLPVIVQGSYPDPVIEGLHGEVQVFLGFQFNDGEAGVAVEGEQIEHAAIAAGKRRHLRIHLVAAQTRKEIFDAGPQSSFEPALGMETEQRIIVDPVG